MLLDENVGRTKKLEQKKRATKEWCRYILCLNRNNKEQNEGSWKIIRPIFLVIWNPLDMMSRKTMNWSMSKWRETVSNKLNICKTNRAIEVLKSLRALRLKLITLRCWWMIVHSFSYPNPKWNFDLDSREMHEISMRVIYYLLYHIDQSDVNCFQFEEKFHGELFRSTMIQWKLLSRRWWRSKPSEGRKLMNHVISVSPSDHIVRDDVVLYWN